MFFLFSCFLICISLARDSLAAGDDILPGNPGISTQVNQTLIAQQKMEATLSLITLGIALSAIIIVLVRRMFNPQHI